MWSLGKRYRPLLGLDITTSSVKLIELTMSGGQYRVESYAAEPTPHNAINEKAIVDAEAVGEAIRRAVKRSGAKSGDRAMVWGLLSQPTRGERTKGIVDALKAAGAIATRLGATIFNWILPGGLVVAGVRQATLRCTVRHGI